MEEYAKEQRQKVFRPLMPQGVEHTTYDPHRPVTRSVPSVDAARR